MLILGASIAGTHTTSATTGLLLYHLLHSPENLAKCVAEIDSKLPPLEEGQAAYPVMIAESSAPFLKQCVKENFRITPVFTMPLARRVVDPTGVKIGTYHFPQGVSLETSFTALPYLANIRLDRLPWPYAITPFITTLMCGDRLTTSSTLRVGKTRS